MTWEKLKEVLDNVSKRFGDSVSAVVEEGKIAKLVVEAGKLVEVAEHLRDLGFDHVKAVTGIDLVKLRKGGGNLIEVSYQLGSYTVEELRDSILNLSVKVDRDNPQSPSLYKVWPSVEYHEREVYEMLGVKFQGHPDLRRLLLPEYWMDIPPLRKDYKVPGRD